MAKKPTKAAKKTGAAKKGAPVKGAVSNGAGKRLTDERKVGRPPKYEKGFDAQAEKLCRLGATDMETADFFGVTTRTLYRWKLDHPTFCQALKAGKDALDERVVSSLYHRAVGYTHDAVKIFMPAGARAPVYAGYREHVPPDTTAAIFWLKNRQSAEWRDKQEVAVTLPDVSITLNLNGKPKE